MVIKCLDRALRYESSFRACFIFGAQGLTFAHVYEPERSQRWILATATMLLFVVEALNTSVETTVDRISTREHDLSGHAKDLGATAVWAVTILNLYLWSEWLAGQWQLESGSVFTDVQTTVTLFSGTLLTCSLIPSMCSCLMRCLGRSESS